MATRPIFKVTKRFPYVQEELIDFDWHKGMAATQKQKSVRSLHSAAHNLFNDLNVLEISTKSESTLGVNLSAFNLLVTLKNGREVPLENIFHASKVFENGGPFKELLTIPTHEVKRDSRLVENGCLTGFFTNGKTWPLTPKTIFYDWIYINALKLNKELNSQIIQYNAFTDIEFNPKKSVNCQARAAALYVSLVNNGILEQVTRSADEFIAHLSQNIESYDSPVQKDLFI